MLDVVGSDVTGLGGAVYAVPVSHRVGIWDLLAGGRRLGKERIRGEHVLVGYGL